MAKMRYSSSCCCSRQLNYAVIGLTMAVQQGQFTSLKGTNLNSIVRLMIGLGIGITCIFGFGRPWPLTKVGQHLTKLRIAFFCFTHFI